MSAAPCPRLFEAEALRDGRLSGAERASFERHVRACPVCSREVRALETLGRALRDATQGLTEVADATDELHVRRERTRLLAAFDRVLVTPGPSRPRRVLLGSAAAAALLVVSLLVLVRLRTHEEPGREAPIAVVHPDGAAEWSERSQGSSRQVSLARGALWIHVEHAVGDGRLVVLLPDGELDDTGTTFTVAAEDGHTTRVAVEEGRVVLRLRGRPEVAIGAGGTWIADLPATVAGAGASGAPSSEPPPSAQPSASVTPSPPSRPSAAAASAGAPDPSVDFRAAMDALDRGDNRQAATRFGTFLEKHPRDSRTEDAAYLRVIALQRCGDTGGMRAAATDYLGRYPAGFRRAEMEKLSR